MKIRAVGIDLAFANVGFAAVDIDSDTLEVFVGGLQLLRTEKGPDAKVVRVSSDRLRRAQELREGLNAACLSVGAQFAFVEVPSGTQNASAAFGLGIAVGVLASCPVPIIEVNPMEVKAAVAGRKVRKGATKAQVIAWAEARWPRAPWIRAEHAAVSRKKGKAPVTLPAGRLTDDNEHLADALASVVAGINTPEFRRLIALGIAGGQQPRLTHAATSDHHERPAPRRRAELLLPVGPVPVAGEAGRRRAR